MSSSCHTENQENPESQSGRADLSETSFDTKLISMDFPVTADTLKMGTVANASFSSPLRAVALLLRNQEMLQAATPFIREVVSQLKCLAAELGFALRIEVPDKENAQAEAERLRSQNDGILFLRDVGDPVMEQVLERGFPAVSVFSRPDFQFHSACFVASDNVAGGFAATTHLIEQGHTRIGFVRSRPGITSMYDRYQGYLAAHGFHGVSVNPWLLVSDEYLSMTEAIHELMRRPDYPTALFCWNDDAAWQVLRILEEELHLQVPHDVSIVGFDGLNAAWKSNNHLLTTVSQPFEAILRTAVELLLAQKCGEKILQHQWLLSPKMQLGETTTAPHSL